jgi:pimeloyl-ACP methyl ester carboxylesterase
MQTTLRAMRFYFAALIAALCCAPTGFAAERLAQHIVKVDDHPISVWSLSASRPKRAILLVHGRTWSAVPNFDLQMPKRNRSVMRSLTARGYAVYAVDLRGYGATPRNADGWNTPNQGADDIAHVLRWIAQRHAKLDKPTLLGWSMGSTLAQLAAQRHPDVLSDLILYGYPRDPGATPTIPPTPAEPPREVNTRQRAISDFISPEVTSQELIDTYAAAVLKSDPIRADWKNLEEYRALDPAQAKAPTLVLHGNRDPLAPIAAQSRLFVGLGNPDKQWVILAGGDHAAMLEDTHDAFIAAIAAFGERPRLRR